jgi:integrase/recombinase XerD
MNNHPIELLIIQYLSEKDITRGTWELYNTVLKQYSLYLKEHQILYAKTSNVINYREWKRGQGYSVRWIYHQISAIKGLYQYLRLNQKRLDLPIEYTFDITESIKNEQIKNRISKPILTISQAKHLILCTKKIRKYIWHYRDHAMIYMMITTGLRSIEIRRARKKDLRVVNNQLVLYVQGKGRKSRDEYVKISPGVKEAINDYLNKRKDKNPYLFISHSKHTDIPYLSRTFFIRMFKRVLEDCDLEETKITPHSLRHTAATLNLLRGGSLEETKRFMRHTNMSSTLVYAHHINRLKDDSQNQIEKFILGEESFVYGDYLIELEL